MGRQALGGISSFVLRGIVVKKRDVQGQYKYASPDDRIDGFDYYLGYIKFGIGRTTSDSAHDIRDNKFTRGEGIALVRSYDGEFPSS